MWTWNWWLEWVQRDRGYSDCCFRGSICHASSRCYRNQMCFTCLQHVFSFGLCQCVSWRRICYFCPVRKNSFTLFLWFPMYAFTLKYTQRKCLCCFRWRNKVAWFVCVQVGEGISVNLVNKLIVRFMTSDKWTVLDTNSVSARKTVRIVVQSYTHTSASQTFTLFKVDVLFS